VPNSPSDDHGWSSVTGAKTRTGRSRLEHRHGWQDAVMAGGDLGSVGGSAHPYALPRVWGRSLERKFAILLT